MGQYWIPVNLDKREFVSPSRLGCGLKLWEQLANHPGTGAALIVLCAAMPKRRGGGDLDLAENWHGPERQPETNRAHACAPAPMPEGYAAIAKRTIGRWAGDRIALIGDYAEVGDLFACGSVGTPKCVPTAKGDGSVSGSIAPPAQLSEPEVWAQCMQDGGTWTDVSADVAAVIQHELHGKFDNPRGFTEWIPARESEGRP